MIAPHRTFLLTMAIAAIVGLILLIAALTLNIAFQVFHCMEAEDSR
jgi:hypothetical protein